MTGKFSALIAWIYDRKTSFEMNNTQALAKLKAAMLSAQTLGELYALMEVYSYQEFMHIYEQLPSQQQAAIDRICDRDSQIQMAATTTIPV
jgi:hypothetical protein